MPCLVPIRIRSGKDIYDVPCGYCLPCKRRRSNEWASRIIDESRYHKDVTFLTLTYDTKYLPDGGNLCKKDFQDFMKRLRKNTGMKFRYFACGQYGERNGRPHYHAIIFGLKPDEDIILPIWKKGFVAPRRFLPANAHYVARYCTRFYDNDVVGKEPMFTLMSRNPGIGYRFLEDNWFSMLKEGTIRRRGKPMLLPRYYKEKLLHKFDGTKLDRHFRAVSRSLNLQNTYKYAIDRDIKDVLQLERVRFAEAKQEILNIEGKLKLKNKGR